jgi:hypothetical protein
LGDRLKKLLVSTKKKFIFNGIIKSYSISFMKLGVAAGIQMMMMVGNSPYLKESEKI